MAPPGVFSFYDNLEKNCYNYQSPSSPSLLLSPFPSSCINPSVFSDHDYIIKKTLDPILKSPSAMAHEDAFGFPVSGDICCDGAMTPEKDINSALSPGGHSDVFDDVTLSDRQRMDLSSGDTDFLQDLDELEFDFDDLDSCRDVNDENNFQNFIDATLDDGITYGMPFSTTDNNNNYSSSNNNNNNNSFNSNHNSDGCGKVAEEEVSQKDLFMKYLGLQTTCQKPVSSSTSPSRSRKRKYEEEEECLTPISRQTSFPSISISLNVPQTQTILSSAQPHPHNLHNRHNPHFPNPSHHNTSSLSSSLSSSLLASTSSSSSLITSSPVHYVPSKLCSCSATDWQRTMLYSTAKASSSASVQTSPSTASSASWLHAGRSAGGVQNIPPAPFSLSSDALNQKSDVLRPLPPLVIPSESYVGSHAVSVDDDFELEMVSRGEIDEDTEDLLLWLDTQEIQKTIAGSCAISAGNSLTSNNYNYARSSPSSDGSAAYSDDDLASVLDPRSHASMEMDSFTDLEAYVTEDPCPLQQDNNAPFNPTSTGDSNNTTNAMSKSQLRLSILADISNEVINKKKKNEDHTLKADFSSFSRSAKHHVTKLTNQATDYVTQSGFAWPRCSPVVSASSLSSSLFSGDSSSSSLSPQSLLSSSSSSLSSPSSSVSSLSPAASRYSHLAHSKPLDLLDLFADENSSMLFGV